MYVNLRRRMVALACVPLVVPFWTVIPEAIVAAPKPRPVPTALSSLALNEVDGVSASALAAAGTIAASKSADKAKDVALTPPTDTKQFRLVGISWDAGQRPLGLTASVRTKVSGKWTDWQEVPYDDDHGPDAGSAEAVGTRGGTDPLIVEKSTGVQVRVRTEDGRRPNGLRADLVSPGTSDADASVGQQALGTAQAAAAKPTILTRKDWGADESIKTEGATFGEINGSFIHHTAGSNSYTEADVPGIIRGIYAYHVQSRGWKDIGYNFLVDKYGRIWEGRYGGVDKPVIGAHTSGYNDDAFAMSTLGTLTTTYPTQPTLDAYARLYAWKLGLHHIDPKSTANLDGTLVRAISGHRDAGQTECPGQKLYDKIPTITTATRTLMGAMLFKPSASTTGWSYGATTGVTVKAALSQDQTYRVDMSMACLANPVRTLTGSATLANGLSVKWDGKLSTGKLAPPGTYKVTVTTKSADGKSSDTWVTSVKVTATATSPAALCTGTTVVTATPVPTVSATPTPTPKPTATTAPVALPSTTHVAPVTVNEAFAVDADKVFTLKGHAWGHGRSMSQYGANGAASTGLKYAEILKFYYPGTALGAVGNPRLRVWLTTDTGYDAIVRAESGLRVAYYAQGSGNRLVVELPTTLAELPVVSWRFRVVNMGTYDDAQIQGYSGGAWRTWMSTEQVISNQPMEFIPADGTINVTNRTTDERRTYRGRIVALRSGAELVVNNVVTIDAYLRSVVPNEMPAWWRAEAVKSQTVAARTFALAEASRRSAMPFDVYDDTRSQMYRGVSYYNTSWALLGTYEDVRTTAAVTATTGKGLLYAAKPIRSQFSSTNGGATLGDTGGSTWERTYADPFEKLVSPPSANWTDTISAATLQARFPSIGTLARIRVTQRSGVGDWKGRIMVVKLEGSKGTMTLTGDSAVRSAFGTNSSWFTVVP